jgi:DNA polymerase III subunit delta'
MPIIPVFGHGALQDRLTQAARQRTLPASLLFQGPRGVGKQRLALWTAQLLLCEHHDRAPCGACQSCRFALDVRHPDLAWYFPRPRLKDADPDVADVREDYAEAIATRVADAGLYAPPSGSEAIYIATVRAIVHQAAMSPAIGRRKVFVIGDAERMVPQEGSEQAANAFLKLLEEPPEDTTVILTSSEPGALLPTVRSRVVSFRPTYLPDADVAAFLANDAVAGRLKGDRSIPASGAQRMALASGAPGRLLAGQEWALAVEQAERMIESVTGNRSRGARHEAAWAQASTKARGAFADSLDALTVALHARAREAAGRGADREAAGAARAMEYVELAKERVASNVSPQLITVNLLREIEECLA